MMMSPRYEPLSQNELTQEVDPPQCEEQLSSVPEYSTPPSCWGHLFFSMNSMKYSLVRPEFVIGRGSTCDIVINDNIVSGKHCSIVREEDGNVYLVDHSSSNGTYFNGNVTKIAPKEKIPLKTGNSFSLIVPHHKFKCHGVVSAATPRLYSFVFTASIDTNPFSGPICDKYEPMSRIGSGTYATVWKAVEKLTNQPYAVKVVKRKRFMGGPSWEEQLNEANTLKNLSHPNIIQFVDLFVSENTLYIVTELVMGGELYEKLVTGYQYSEDEGRVLIKNLLDAVAYMHSKDIVHRDLKPENILLQYKESNVDIKLADFGVAKATENGRRNTLCGSMTYIAPEVLDRKDTVYGIGTYGKEVDMWSIGVIVCVLFTLRPPFESESDATFRQSMERSLSFNEPEWGFLSDAGKHFVSRLLTVDAAQRMTAEEALTHPWILGRNSVDPDGATANTTPKQALTPKLRYRDSLPPSATRASASYASTVSATSQDQSLCDDANRQTTKRELWGGAAGPMRTVNGQVKRSRTDGR